MPRVKKADITFEKLLVHGQDSLPSITLLLGRLAMPIANMQIRWIRESVHLNQLPCLLPKSDKEKKRWIRAHAGQVSDKISSQELKQQMLVTYKVIVRDHLQHLANQIVQVPSYQQTSSMDDIIALIRVVRSEKLRGLLQEIFILLSSHVLLPKSTYEAIVKRYGWNSRSLTCAEGFVFRLVSQEPDTMRLWFQELVRIFPEGHIPPTRFNGLEDSICKTLANPEPYKMVMEVEPESELDRTLAESIRTAKEDKESKDKSDEKGMYCTECVYVLMQFF